MDERPLLEELLTRIDAVLPRAIELRERLHAEPYVGGFEEPTRDLLLEWLPWAEPEPVADTGMVVAVGPADAPAVGVRAELDALPIRDRTGVPWSATNGNAHACGHDVHMAAAWALLEAARSLADLPARLVTLFQPREENQPSGARDIVRAGTLGRHGVRAVIGAHVQPQLPAGVVSTGAGAINAAFDEFEIVVHGRPGHGAYPHTTLDPIPVLANIVSTTHELVSRAVDPTHPSVVSIGWLRADGTENAIAAEARCGGTTRATSEQDRAELHAGLRRLCAGIADARGATVDVTIDLGGPALINDADLVVATDPLLAAAGFELLEPPMRSCGSDDFSYYAEQVPILMMFVGVTSTPAGAGLHHPAFLPDADAVRETARALACAYVGAAQKVSQP